MSVRVVPTVEEIELAARASTRLRSFAAAARTALDEETGARSRSSSRRSTRSARSRAAAPWSLDARGGAARTADSRRPATSARASHTRRAPRGSRAGFVGRIANPRKVAAMRRLGARVEVGGEDFDAAIATAAAFAAEHGSALRPGRPTTRDRGRRRDDGRRADRAPGVLPHVALVPVGNGALIIGVGAWLRPPAPGVRSSASCAEGAPAPADSWRRRAPLASASATTVADGSASGSRSPRSVAGMLDLVDDMVSSARPSCAPRCAGSRTSPACSSRRRAPPGSPRCWTSRRVPRRDRVHPAVRREPPAGRARNGHLSGGRIRAPPGH